jgi:hypothetical protein
MPHGAELSLPRRAESGAWLTQKSGADVRSGSVAGRRTTPTRMFGLAYGLPKAAVPLTANIGRGRDSLEPTPIWVESGHGVGRLVLAAVSDETKQGKFLDQLAGLSKYVDVKIPDPSRRHLHKCLGYMSVASVGREKPRIAFWTGARCYFYEAFAILGLARVLYDTNR